jgi:hypothetical protein
MALTTKTLLKMHFSFFSGFGSGGNGVSPNDPWQLSQPSNMAMIKDLQVQCEKDMMRVRVVFDRPFYGMVFSKGHYSNINCVHVPSGLGQTSVSRKTVAGNSKTARILPNARRTLARLY